MPCIGSGTREGVGLWHREGRGRGRVGVGCGDPFMSLQKRFEVSAADLLLPWVGEDWPVLGAGGVVGRKHVRAGKRGGGICAPG